MALPQTINDFLFKSIGNAIMTKNDPQHHSNVYDSTTTFLKIAELNTSSTNEKEVLINEYDSAQTNKERLNVLNQIDSFVKLEDSFNHEEISKIIGIKYILFLLKIANLTTEAEKHEYSTEFAQFLVNSGI